MGTAVQRHDHLGICQTVKRQCAGHRNHVPTVNQSFAIRAVCCIKMHLCRVLPQAGGEHMFRLFHGDAIDVVDHLAHGVITPAVRLTRKIKIVVTEIEPLGDDQIGGINHI